MLAVLRSAAGASWGRKRSTFIHQDSNFAVGEKGAAFARFQEPFKSFLAVEKTLAQAVLS